jgi:NAD-dependent SIR2 family protein deacetylase
VKQWIQQNHDGLAQKSGFPMSKLNEIHGSWFDKKNPVVLMDDCLKSKNFNELKEWE